MGFSVGQLDEQRHFGRTAGKIVTRRVSEEIVLNYFLAYASGYDWTPRQRCRTRELVRSCPFEVDVREKRERSFNESFKDLNGGVRSTVHGRGDERLALPGCGARTVGGTGRGVAPSPRRRGETGERFLSAPARGAGQGQRREARLGGGGF